ncbi:MAG: hypothetical protein AAF219_11075 [Myxococcota bacterium]
MDAITWSVDGQITSYDAGTVSFDASYDLSGQAVARTYQGSVGHRFDWQIETRDPAGNIELVSDAAGEKTYGYTYDIQSRIATSDGEVVRGYSDCDWIYDAAGNRTSETALPPK